MKTYRVRWEIDVEAEDPHEAAEMAFGHMQRLETTACVFEVADPQTGERTQVDLLERCGDGPAA